MYIIDIGANSSVHFQTGVTFNSDFLNQGFIEHRKNIHAEACLSGRQATSLSGDVDPLEVKRNDFPYKMTILKVTILLFSSYYLVISYQMKYIKQLLIVFSLICSAGYGQQKALSSFIPQEDLLFLERMTQDVTEASRIHPNQFISKELGSNNTGETLIRPGGRNAYPSFWIRDYAMSLETGFISLKEQKHMLLLTASTQCDQAKITKGGSLIPYGAIADHIRIDDSRPIYFPGTYDYEKQGTPAWGTLPPFCDQFLFIHMASFYVKQSKDYKILLKEINGIKLIDRLKIAFHVPPSEDSNHIVYTTESLRGIDFGFRDAQTITGDLCFTSILKYRAAKELSGLLETLNQSESKKYLRIGSKIKQSIPQILMDERGMLRASTGKSNQPDVWATALAIYSGILEGKELQKASKMLADAYRAGTLSYKGNIRHILTTDDFNENTAWEISLSPKNTYQNGAYWGTASGWVCYAINVTDPSAASQLANEYINELRENDFRKGDDFGAPYECFNASGYNQNPVYLTSVACPLIAFRKMMK